VIASVLSDRPIRHDVAMTGEVSLRGKVLLVGGLREKALAAYRAGFRTLLFPAVNLKDIGDVPADVRDKLELVPVDTMDEVFSIALHRVILPTKIAGQFIIEVDDDDEDDDNDSSSDAEQIAKGGR
jgi:ATP-dependent Lon protease